MQAYATLPIGRGSAAQGVHNNYLPVKTDLDELIHQTQNVHHHSDFEAGVGGSGGLEKRPISEAMPCDEDDQFDKRQKVSAAGDFQKKGTWSPGEDALLRSLIKSNPKKNWSEIANKVPGRSAKQCRERWSYNLDPSINKEPWTLEEDRTIIKMQAELGNRWAHIANMLTQRTENAVKTRYKSIIRARKREWKRSEDESILQMYKDLGSQWGTIAEALKGRTKNAVKTRYRLLSKGKAYKNPEAGSPRQVLTEYESLTLKSVKQLPSTTTGLVSGNLHETSGSGFSSSFNGYGVPMHLNTVGMAMQYPPQGYQNYYTQAALNQVPSGYSQAQQYAAMVIPDTNMGYGLYPGSSAGAKLQEAIQPSLIKHRDAFPHYPTFQDNME
eukprot:snap_masked-scaffold_6-processed-gene-16.55-mRNA-1 protein AED:0.23 eAED:0.23 QI:0/-1/0/1/-1/1/1/0/383